MKQKYIAFFATPKIEKVIEAERRRMGKNESTERVSKSAAVRSLLTRASTTTATPNP